MFLSFIVIDSCALSEISFGYILMKLIKSLNLSWTNHFSRKERHTGKKEKQGMEMTEGRTDGREVKMAA